MEIETTYSFTSDSDLTAIEYDSDAEKFVRKECPIYWAVYTITRGETTAQVPAQFDCGDSWCWYFGGGDGDSSEEVAEHFFNTDDPEFIKFLDEILRESEPDTEITLEEKAEYIRDYMLDDDDRLQALADAVLEICPEKGSDWALVQALYYRDGINDVGSFECHLQITAGLEKNQTLQLAQLFLTT
jgi:hypothetical protein